MSNYYKVRITAWRDFIVKAKDSDEAWSAAMDEHYMGDFENTEGDISDAIEDEAQIEELMGDSEVTFIDWTQEPT